MGGYEYGILQPYFSVIAKNAEREQKDEFVKIVKAELKKLGNAVHLWDLPGVQRQIAEKCRAAGKPFMVVTQMLASMERSPVPTRAEVNDIFHAVMDGAASIMVTGETAVGDYPVEVIRYMVNTVRSAEKEKNR